MCKLFGMHSQAEIDDTTTLGELAAAHPARIEVFERLRLDYCCGGSSSLRDACRERGLDFDAVREEIAAIDHGAGPLGQAPERDWREAPLDELCEHIVSVHHGYLRRETPRISHLLATVVRVHGADCMDFEIVERTFASLRGALEEHIDEEEQALFPACLALARGAAAGLDRETIDRHRDEHDDVGRKLAALRVLAGDYEPSQALCSTHGALLDALRHFEADLHQHVHEENNVLFPRASALLDSARNPTASPPADARA